MVYTESLICIVISLKIVTVKILTEIKNLHILISLSPVSQHGSSPCAGQCLTVVLVKSMPFLLQPDRPSALMSWSLSNCIVT